MPPNQVKRIILMDPRRGEPVIIEDEWVITAWLTIKEWVESDPTHQCPTGEELWLLLELYSQQQKAGIEFDAGKIVAEVAKILEKRKCKICSSKDNSHVEQAGKMVDKIDSEASFCNDCSSEQSKAATKFKNGDATVAKQNNAKGNTEASEALSEDMKSLDIQGGRNANTSTSAAGPPSAKSPASRTSEAPIERGRQNLATSETSKGKVYKGGCDEEDESYSDDDYDDDEDDKDDLAALDIRPGVHGWLE